MDSVLDSPPGYTALGPADLGAVYPGALLDIVHYSALYARAACDICLLYNFQICLSNLIGSNRVT